jgi:2-polyprenyl-3-methyl-5-hydroxy-6-metoxy-1,4-benzoquinol methylase
MLDPGVLAFARGVLPEPPARVLEVGAGDGELAAALRAAGYDVTAIDPKAGAGTGVEPTALIDATGAYDAAIAVVSLHHVEPLADSCEHLARLIEPGGVLAIDELDVGRYDERVTTRTSTTPAASSRRCAATSTRSTRSGRRSPRTSTSASRCAARSCTAGTSLPGCATPRSA